MAAYTKYARSHKAPAHDLLQFLFVTVEIFVNDNENWSRIVMLSLMVIEKRQRNKNDNGNHVPEGELI